MLPEGLSARQCWASVCVLLWHLVNCKIRSTEHSSLGFQALKNLHSQTPYYNISVTHARFSFPADGD